MIYSRAMDIQDLSSKSFLKATLIAIAATIAIVGAASLLGRATIYLQAALTDKPDLGVYLLLEKEGFSNIADVQYLEDDSADSTVQRSYLVETGAGPLYVKIRKGEQEWYLAEEDWLRE